MKSIVLFVLALLVTCGLASPSIGATNSDGTLSLTTQNLALWPGYCGDSTYTISGNYTQAPYWNVDITVYDPHNQIIGGDYWYTSSPGNTDSSHLCIDYDLAGTYRVTAKWETDDSNYNQTGQGTVTGYFTLSPHPKYASTLSSAETKYGKHRWQVIGTVTVNGKPWVNHPVHIQAYMNRAWRNVLSANTNRYGRVAFFATPTQKVRKYVYRLHSSGGTYAHDANSATFRFRRR